MSINKISIQQKFETFREQWKPKIVAELNGQYVKLVRFKGEFVWHHHDNEDEMFLVVEGSFTMKFRNCDVVINRGEMIVVPAGVEHKPVADEECQVMLFEPKTTLNTGNVNNERTVPVLERI